MDVALEGGLNLLTAPLLMIIVDSEGNESVAVRVFGPFFPSVDPEATCGVSEEQRHFTIVEALIS